MSEVHSVDHLSEKIVLPLALFEVFTVWCCYKGWARFGLIFRMFRFLGFLTIMNQCEQKCIDGSLSSLSLCDVSYRFSYQLKHHLFLVYQVRSCQSSDMVSFLNVGCCDENWVGIYYILPFVLANCLAPS